MRELRLHVLLLTTVAPEPSSAAGPGSNPPVDRRRPGCLPGSATAESGRSRGRQPRRPRGWSRARRTGLPIVFKATVLRLTRSRRCPRLLRSRRCPTRSCSRNRCGIPELDVVEVAGDDHVAVEAGVLAQVLRDRDPALLVGRDLHRAGEERPGGLALARPARPRVLAALARPGGTRSIGKTARQPSSAFAITAPPSSWSRKRAGRMTRPFASRECWCSPRNIGRAPPWPWPACPPAVPSRPSVGKILPFPPPGATLCHHFPPRQPTTRHSAYPRPTRRRPWTHPADPDDRMRRAALLVARGAGISDGWSGRDDARGQHSRCETRDRARYAGMSSGVRPGARAGGPRARLRSERQRARAASTTTAPPDHSSGARCIVTRVRPLSMGSSSMVHDPDTDRAEAHFEHAHAGPAPTSSSLEESLMSTAGGPTCGRKRDAGRRPVRVDGTDAPSNRRPTSHRRTGRAAPSTPRAAARSRRSDSSSSQENPRGGLRRRSTPRRVRANPIGGDVEGWTREVTRAADGQTGRRRTRSGSCTCAARAAFAPGPPWTPPPGCADAEARNSDRTGVSARPHPGIGRNTSCWWSCAVPPLSAPPTRFASFGLERRRRQHVPTADRAVGNRVHALRSSPPWSPTRFDHCPFRRLDLGAVGAAGCACTPTPSPFPAADGSDRPCSAGRRSGRARAERARRRGRALSPSRARRRSRPGAPFPRPSRLGRPRDRSRRGSSRP